MAALIQARRSLALANTISKLISEAVIMKMLMLVVMLARNG